MKLHELAPPQGSTHSKKRVGRGHGSGHVKTSGRGTKGQKSRAGGNVSPLFEGGQTRTVKRVPYLRGFRNVRFKTHFAIINVSRLELLPEDTEVTLESLLELNWVKEKTTGPGKFGGLKVLGDGRLSKRLTVRASKISASAKEKIAAAGGSAEELVVGPTESA